MPSISAPSDAPAPIAVWHYDGASARRRQSVLEPDGARFRLAEGGAASAPFAFADLIARDTVDGDAVFGLRDRPGWRIGFAGGVPPGIADRLPRASRYGGVIDRFGLWPSVVASAVVAALAVMLFLRTPAMVARAVPPSVERQLGTLMVGDFGNRSCAGPGGPEALSAIVERIDPHDPLVEVRVVNLPIVNAVTLPGGRIVLFDGLIRGAKSPEEVAGVLAHEIGHVRHRDVMESLLRQLGLSVLLGGLDGNVGGYTNALLAATYSRDAEWRADDYALAALDRAHVSPRPLGQFFERLSGEAGGKHAGAAGTARMMSYFSTHPMSRDRAARFAAAARGRTDDRPILADADWGRLRSICADDPRFDKTLFPF